MQSTAIKKIYVHLEIQDPSGFLFANVNRYSMYLKRSWKLKDESTLDEAIFDRDLENNIWTIFKNAQNTNIFQNSHIEANMMTRLNNYR